MSIKIGMVSLGCPKNQVDAEQMLYLLQENGFEITPDEAQADVIIVNTCGFIDRAKKESIDTILDVATLKTEGNLKALIVTGCLAERYMQDILHELPEVDAVVGIGASKDICRIVNEVLQNGTKQSYPADKSSLLLDGKRILANDPYYAYLRIADGCDNCCTYCAIPAIRGRYRSRSMESIVQEAQTLAQNGVKELIVVAQDVTRYGIDLYGELKLPALLKELCKIDGIVWIRLLYTYPDKITDELLEVIGQEQKIVKYLDMPLQHCNGEILKHMNRSGDRKSLTALIQKIRRMVPDMVLRTTFIAGFPGESEQQFEELCEFVQEIRFERMGAFAYSAEEGTVAATMPEQVEQSERTRRMELLMERQSVINEQYNTSRVGQTLQVLCEGYDPYIKHYYGRSAADAPDIDCKVFFRSAKKVAAGSFVFVAISDQMEYDLLGDRVDG